MRRALLMVWMSCFALVLSDVAPYVEQGCESGCPDDDADGNCAPDCADCNCCLHLRAAVDVGDERMLSMSQHGSHAPVAVVRVPVAPEPNEILHVPIAA